MTPSERLAAGQTLRLLAVGVGGQGVLTATRLLGEAALSMGIDVRLGQLHGMSQRGGSVESTLLIGPGHSSFIGPGEADVVLGLEPLEVLRARPRMSAATLVLLNLGRVVPFPLAMQGQPYPELRGLVAEVAAVAGQLVEIDGPALCEQAGSPQVLNIVMLGALGALAVLPFDADALRETVVGRSKAQLREPNRRAFELGYAAARAERPPTSA